MIVTINFDGHSPVIEMRPESERDCLVLDVIEGMADCKMRIEYDVDPPEARGDLRTS
jgi:hypothetical protein